jgi:GDP-L-fucose synthase
MPTNLYGPGDNYHPENSHVLPAMIRRFHEAKLAETPQVVIWGTGSAKREFLYVDDMAKACIHVMDLSSETYKANTEQMHSHINVGTGEDLSIADLARLVAKVVGYEGEIAQDVSKPDGAPRKLLNVDRLNNLGWQASTELGAGIALAYADFVETTQSVEHAQ